MRNEKKRRKEKYVYKYISNLSLSLSTIKYITLFNKTKKEEAEDDLLLTISAVVIQKNKIN